MYGGGGGGDSEKKKAHQNHPSKTKPLSWKHYFYSSI